MAYGFGEQGYNEGKHITATEKYFRQPALPVSAVKDVLWSRPVFVDECVDPWQTITDIPVLPVVEMIPGYQCEAICVCADRVNKFRLTAPDAFQQGTPQQLAVLFRGRLGVFTRDKNDVPVIHCRLIMRLQGMIRHMLPETV